MARNSSSTAQYDGIDDAHGEPTLRAYHDGPNWYEDGVDVINDFFQMPHNIPPPVEGPSTPDTLSDGALESALAPAGQPSPLPLASHVVSESASAPIGQPLPLPLANDTVATLQERHGNSAEGSPDLDQAQAAPSAAQYGGNVAGAPNQTSQSSILTLTSGSGIEQDSFPLSLFASMNYHNTVSPLSLEYEEIYRGPDANTGTGNSYMGPSAPHTNVPHTYDATSPYPADVQDEDGVPSRTPKRRGSDALSTSDQPLKKQAKVSAGNAENGSDVEMLDQEDSDDEDPVQEESNGGDLDQEDSDEGDSEEEESDEGNPEHEDSDSSSDSSAPTFSPITPPIYAPQAVTASSTASSRGRDRGRGRSRGRGRGRGVATTGNAATRVNAITLSLFTNNTLPRNYPFNHPHVSVATIEGKWSRYGFVSLAAARTWISGRP